jgi:hypothetical protein
MEFSFAVFVSFLFSHFLPPAPRVAGTGAQRQPPDAVLSQLGGAVSPLASIMDADCEPRCGMR